MDLWRASLKSSLAVHRTSSREEDATGTEAEARYRIFKSTDIGLGVRYWKLKATGDIQFAGSSSLPLNDFQSTRYGATLSFVSRW